jgi:hypothetical protein
MKTPRTLPIRLGCPLSLLLAAAFVAGAELAIGEMQDRPWSPDTGDLFFVALTLPPFAVLALARTRDWLAWLVALGGSAAMWGWSLYAVSLGNGVNIGLGLFQTFVAPFLISGFAIAVAGMRGAVPEWGVDPPGRGRPSDE